MKPDQERVRCLLRDTIALLCKNGLHFDTDLRVQGLLGVTVDSNDVFIVHIDELIDATAKAKFDIENDSDNEEELPATAITVMQSESDRLGDDQKQARQDNDTHRGSSSGGQRRKRKASSPLRIDRSTNLLHEFNCSDVAESEWLPDHVSSCIGASSDCVTADSPPLSPRVNTKQLDEEAPEDLSLYGMSVKLEEPSSDDDVMLIDARDGGVLDRLQNVAQNSYHSDAEQGDSLPYIGYVPSIIPQHRHHLSSMCKPSTATDVQNSVDQRQSDAIQNAEFPQLHSSCHSPGGGLTFQNPTKPPAESSPIGTNLAQSTAGAHNQIPMLMHRSLPPSLYSAEWAVQRLLSWSRGRGSHHHMIRAPTRRKRYECTLNDCGRQYLNTFDLYRHQRQKHMMPADFYQQGKKQTFGIREVIDPGGSSSNCATALKSSDNSSQLNDHSALGGGGCVGASDAIAKW